jgi:hypothetical protein
LDARVLDASGCEKKPQDASGVDFRRGTPAASENHRGRALAVFSRALTGCGLLPGRAGSAHSLATRQETEGLYLDGLLQSASLTESRAKCGNPNRKGAQS